MFMYTDDKLIDGVYIFINNRNLNFCSSTRLYSMKIVCDITNWGICTSIELSSQPQRLKQFYKRFIHVRHFDIIQYEMHE